MIQILGLRPYFSDKKQKWDVTDNTFYKKNWRAASVAELFANIAKHVSEIPEMERYNIFYTVANCAEGKRQFSFQDVMVFDVDGLDPSKDRELYITAVLGALGVKREQTGIVFSGNGLHFIIGIKSRIQEPVFFDENRRHYTALRSRIDSALVLNGLSGASDPAVFDARRIMRLPGTTNRKEGKQERLAELIQSHIEPIDFDIAKLSGLPHIEASEQVNAQALKRFPTADTGAVLQGCEFLKDVQANPERPDEPELYAALSIIGRLPDAEAHAQKIFAPRFGKRKHCGSSGDVTAKLAQSIEASGPRTCNSINNIWGKCGSCPNFGKINSPIMLRSEGYIKTRDSGFHDTYVDEKGNVRVGKPNFEDLRAFFESKFQYVVLSDTILVWNGKYFEEMPHKEIEAFAQEHFNPAVKTDATKEFLNRVTRSNIKRAAWFEKTTFKHMNFQNGVLDLESRDFLPHSPDRGFRHVLPYDYDAKAEAPLFKKFLGDVTAGDQALQDILIEFAGYAFSNDSCWTGKCLLLTGEGSNGKSTFIKAITALAGGKDQIGSLTLADIKSEVARSQLDGRMLNIAEETPVYAAVENSAFKNLVTGGSILVKQLYKQPYTITNRCKFIFACNDLPVARDTTNAYLRRLLIVPFNVKFEGANDDKKLETKLLAELPGIFNLVLQGYDNLRERQSFTESKIASDSLAAYRMDIDTVHAWIDACVEFVAIESNFVSLEKLYSAYRIFTDSRGTKPLEYVPFAKALRRNLPSDRKADREDRKVIEGKKITVVKGIKYVESTGF